MFLLNNSISYQHNCYRHCRGRFSYFSRFLLTSRRVQLYARVPRPRNLKNTSHLFVCLLLMFSSRHHFVPQRCCRRTSHSWNARFFFLWPLPSVQCDVGHSVSVDSNKRRFAVPSLSNVSVITIIINSIIIIKIIIIIIVFNQLKNYLNIYSLVFHRIQLQSLRLVFTQSIDRQLGHHYHY